jgi:hypothetical protein
MLPNAAIGRRVEKPLETTCESRQAQPTITGTAT